MLNFLKNLLQSLKRIRAYRKKSKKGWQGDKTACHKGFAPFLEGDRGDRRVTGWTSPIPSCRRGMATERRFLWAKGWLRMVTSFYALEFSREFGCLEPPEMCKVALYVWILSRICFCCNYWPHPQPLPYKGGERLSASFRGRSAADTACHPSVTPVTL